uniref:Ataxin-1-like n=1 Tax=Aceria tosichella TaxID=561515 RepID=A0A6G1SAS8_9ACAR
MQYPEIQFYRGSLVRLASGQLKQVEDLSSDDFIESARMHPKSTPRMKTNAGDDYDEDEEEIDVELDVVTTHDDNQDFYIDSSVVRDFLEVGPIQQQANQRLPASTSPASSTNSLNNQDQHNNNHHSQAYSLPSTSSTSSSSNSLQSSSSSCISPPVLMPQILSTASPTASQTVLIKFFLESSRSVVFIEVPIEHPFFVFHRGWSSWNPQRTYDKFGLKCRKLKIGDTCISLIRRKQNQNQQQDSDQCNILFSSIKINE